MSSMIQEFIHVNQYTRPGIKLNGVKKLIIHYTANPGASAQNHHDYFDKTAPAAGTYASAHVFVDKTQAIQIIPFNEVAYAANDVQQRNADGSAWRGVKELLPNANFLSISVELCIEKDGSFHPDTVSRAVDVFVELCKQFNLTENDIVRHFDVTHKQCPLPYVNDVKAFADFKARVKAKLAPATVATTPKPVVSNPVPTKPAPAPVTQSVEKKQYVVLPATADAWTVYKLGKPPVKDPANIAGTLAPKKFNGLTYQVLGNPQKDVYTISTSNFGKVNIYAASSTGAKIITK